MDDLNYQKGKIAVTLVGNGESYSALEQAKRSLSSVYMSRARLRQGLGAGSSLERSYQEKDAWQWEMEAGKGEHQEDGALSGQTLWALHPCWWQGFSHTCP